ncbi:Hypothetical protein Bdt_1330 [Bdellovibrio bacteriovorus str. Tiberius]|uniref:Uncharacterized protein n=1 Tax=Bdellovibrio bacteriovorus str. Tiberius TaxID=1069642 RepID=K7YTS2_BDEBC|nr:Hypothetical protein Bdt_1330 [Bdellovibrio bacteriovorus str. Tiberius]
MFKGRSRLSKKQLSVTGFGSEFIRTTTSSMVEGLADTPAGAKQVTEACAKAFPTSDTPCA